MKTHKSDKLKRPILLVELPVESKIEEGDWYVDSDSNVRQSVIEYDEDYWSRRLDYVKIPEELVPLFKKYSLLGKLCKIKENDVKDLVEKITSFWSALESEIHWENPYKKPNGEDYYYEESDGFDGVETLWDEGSYNEDLDRFKEAQSKTFDKTRTIILVENEILKIRLHE